MTDSYPWTRQKGESGPGYTAFQAYLHLGPKRSLVKAAEAAERSIIWIEELSAKNGWVERVRAYDVFLEESRTDGMVHQIAASRDKNLALMDKLRGLLDSRLDQFIERKEDPTIRWTQACMAMAKIEANSLLMKDDQKTDERIGRIEELVERALAEPLAP